MYSWLVWMGGTILNMQYTSIQEMDANFWAAALLFIDFTCKYLQYLFCSIHCLEVELDAHLDSWAYFQRSAIIRIVLNPHSLWFYPHWLVFMRVSVCHLVHGTIREKWKSNGTISPGTAEKGVCKKQSQIFAPEHNCILPPSECIVSSLGSLQSWCPVLLACFYAMCPSLFLQHIKHIIFCQTKHASSRDASFSYAGLFVRLFGNPGSVVSNQYTLLQG